jgi:glycosidase
MKPVSPLNRLILAALFGLASLSCAATPEPSAVDTSSVAAADPGSVLAEGWQHGAFAEIFVRGYKDSDGDGIGDLRGLTQSLDYLRDLGVRGIWLMPITRSQDRDHGYAVSDYRDIEPAYGSLADFDELLRQAHARGIGVIIDYVINHSAASNPIFVDASRSGDSRYRSWYVWRDVAPAGWKIMGKDPWVRTPNGAYLAQFSATMPDFNLLNPEVVAYHKDNLRFWLNRGVDGFRFDAVTHLVEYGPDSWYDQPADYALMNEFRGLVDTYSHRYVVCEATRNAAAYAAPGACGAAFALDRGPLIVDAARGKQDAIRAVADFFSNAPPSMATMISNHDLFAGERLWDQVEGDAAQYRLAAATYLLQPGTPFIYYGEEIGMSAAPGLSGDPKLRTPMSWNHDPVNAGFSSAKPYRVVAANAGQQNVDSQKAIPDSLLSYYKALLDLRNRYPSIARGSYESPTVNGKLMSYRRKFGEEITLVLINYGRKRADAIVREMAPSERFAQVFPRGDAAEISGATEGKSTVGVDAQSVMVFVLK